MFLHPFHLCFSIGLKNVDEIAEYKSNINDALDNLNARIEGVLIDI